MNSLIGSETLKLHFGTLFLSTYRLPSFEEVKTIIDDAKLSYYGQPCNFYSALHKLEDILSQVEKRKDELISFSSGQFLRNFSEHLLRSGLLIVPTVKDSSCKRFFRMFLDPAFLPNSQTDVELIYEWSMYVVQFEEANETRTKAALSLVAEISEYVENIFEEALQRKKKIKDELKKKVDESVEKRGVDEVDTQMNVRDDGDDDYDVHDDLVNYRDTKFCLCYEYEVCGDCYCAFDL